jgi:hypothetical protein
MNPGDTVRLTKPFEIKPGQHSYGELPVGAPVKLIELREHYAVVQTFTLRKLRFDIPLDHIEAIPT